MDRPLVTIQLPASLHAELEALAADEQTDLVDVISRLAAVATQRRGWLRELEALRDEIHQHGGIRVGTTKEEVVKRLRESRREIFEAEYAHLYR